MTEYASITCPRCRSVSYNPSDIREGYCGDCHTWTGAPKIIRRTFSMKILCPRCPLCSHRPEVAMNATQVFCSNPECDALCWDATKTLDWNLVNATAHRFDLPSESRGD